MDFKKTIALLLVLCTVLSFASCGIGKKLFSELSEQVEGLNDLTEKVSDGAESETETETEEAYSLSPEFYGIWYVKTGADDHSIEIKENALITMTDGSDTVPAKYKITANDEIAFGIDGARFKLRLEGEELVRLEDEVEDGYTYTKERQLDASKLTGDWATRADADGDYSALVRDIMLSSLEDSENENISHLLDLIDLKKMNEGTRMILGTYVFRFFDDGSLTVKCDPEKYRDALCAFMEAFYDELGKLDVADVAAVFGVSADDLEAGLEDQGIDWKEMCSGKKDEHLEKMSSQTNGQIADQLGGELGFDGLVELGKGDYRIEGSEIIIEDTDGTFVISRENDDMRFTDVILDEDAQDAGLVALEYFKGLTLVRCD